ncbi:MAG: polynucleotide adenylyltransferase [Ruminococcaceae bacterium]|nr:polynucleotide adenylyltransferase [Oscillospiraceae bacterium]
METDIAARVPQFVKTVIDVLERAGHRGYLVGGSLRDLLLGKAPHDFDLTTDATPGEVLEIFRDFRVIPTGLRHGTVTVLSDGNPIEITTHRVDGDYLDSRRPESVSFTRRLSDDLSRRDFTVNAMAWSESEGLIDLFSGREDLKKGIIRAVGNPAARFTEDALRILRAFRFSAQLDFAIEEKTLAGAKATREGLARISAERVFAELCRLLTAAAAQKGLNALVAADCVRYVFFDTVLRENRFHTLTTLPAEPELRLALLLLGDEPSAVRQLCRRLKASNAFTEKVCDLLLAAAEPLPTNLYEARRHVCRYWQAFAGGMLLRQALGEDVTKAAELCQAVAKNGTAIELRRLAVNGKELQERLGVLPVRTGEMLARLQDFCWQDPARNKKNKLIELATEIIGREKDFING